MEFGGGVPPKAGTEGVESLCAAKKNDIEGVIKAIINALFFR